MDSLHTSLPPTEAPARIRRWIPTLLSLSRIPIALQMFRKMEDLRNLWVEAGLLWLLLSDGLDGWLARKLHVRGVWGRVVDHVTDKVVILLLAWGLTLYRDLPSWVAALLTFRETATGGVALWLWRTRKVMPGSRVWGRINGLFGVAGFAAFYYEWTFRFPLLWAYLASALAASLLYARLHLMGGWRT